jgi:hypothetical protein
MCAARSMLSRWQYSPARDTGDRCARQEPGFYGAGSGYRTWDGFPCDTCTRRCPEPDSGPAGSCLRGLPWRTRETAFSSFSCRKTGGPLPRLPWHCRKSKARDREAVFPDTSNWRIIVPDIASSARKTHAKLSCTAFRAVWRPLPVARCVCAQAAGLHARRGSTAVSG